MMSPLRFRTWQTASKTMGFGGVMFNNSTGVLEHDPIVVIMQSTGLFDKNGKEIFEGDIVACGHSVGEVRFLLGGFHVEDDPEHGGHVPILKFNGRQRSYVDDVLNIEVIGNIYENPDLLPSSK